MLRNAELSQQLTTLQQTLQDEKHTLEVEIEAHKEKEKELSIKCQELETKVCRIWFELFLNLYPARTESD